MTRDELKTLERSGVRNFWHQPTAQLVTIFADYGGSGRYKVSTKLDRVPHFQQPEDSFDADVADLSLPCDTCGQPLHLVTSTENGQPWQGWMHENAAADWACGR